MLRSLLPAVLFLVPLCSGCVAAAAAGLIGAGIVQYHRNEVEQDFPNDLYEAWQGSFEGLAHLGIEPTESQLGPSEGRIVYKDLLVLVERHPEGFTRVRVRAGTGKITVNGRPFEAYFPILTHQVIAKEPLRLTQTEEVYDVDATLVGGGVSGQAGAIRLGIARALIALDPELRDQLKKAGFLTRDAREKESKKYGLKKARKAPQYSKR
jgi:small subunit ribosomal protein S9